MSDLQEDQQTPAAKTEEKRQPFVASSDEDEREARTPASATNGGHVHTREKIERNECELDHVQTHARDLVLAPKDYSAQPSFHINRTSYVPSTHLSLTASERKLIYANMSVSVHNAPDLAPIQGFSDLSTVLSPALLQSLNGHYDAPTPIQSLSIPPLLQGRNVIGISKTGSGKTLAYGIPLIAHVSQQPVCNRPGRGPVGLILAPTRELATQICATLQELQEVRIISVIGGLPKYEQFKEIRDSGGDVVVCTPGRMIDMLKMRACTLGRCSVVVLDEADRMLDMGFERQVRGVLGQIRLEAQRVLFSATFPKEVEGLARELIPDAVRIVVGGRNVCDGVSERFAVVANGSERDDWVVENVSQLLEDGLVMIFCSSRAESATLTNTLRQKKVATACVHGETDPGDRATLLSMFRSHEIRVLVTTDVSARGIDIEDVRNVINYTCPKSWDWYVHRVGRTGRAGRRGVAHTLVCGGNGGDMNFLKEATRVWKREGRKIPEELRALTERGRDGAREGRGFVLRGRRRRGRGR